MPAYSYCDLLTWQKAMDLVEQVYRITRKIPKEELYGLTAQVRRAVVSVPSNIAEGHGRRSRNEFRHHLRIAQGSLCELETQLVIIERLHYARPGELQILHEKAGELGRLINGLIRSLAGGQ